jgi:hypothetical protein
VKSGVFLVSYKFVCSLFTMDETKLKMNVKLMKKIERLNQNENKLIYVQNKIAELLTSYWTFEGVQCKPVFL